MAAISLLLLVLVGTINLANILIVDRQTDQLLLKLAESEGLYIPPQDLPEKLPPFPDMPTPDDMMGTRYFFVRFDSGGHVIQINTSNILAVSEAEAQELAQGLRSAGSEDGTTGNFKYNTTHARDQKSSLMIFLDISSQQRSVWTVLLASLSVGVLCWLAMLLPVILLSKRAIHPIARNMEKQKQFVSNAGHEIKTPLAIILANTDALELHEGESKWSRNIRTQAERLSGLMQNLLILARSDEVQNVLPATEFSLSLLLEETLDFYSQTVETRRLELQAAIQPDILIRANRDSMMQLISILLDNATKYTPEGGSIFASLSRESRTVSLQIKNSCQTPPEEDMEKLFDRFYRSDSARTQKNGGYGIGLSAARAIAGANRGKITAAYNERQKMIVFSLTI